jgi:hypothetical protein
MLRAPVPVPVSAGFKAPEVAQLSPALTVVPQVLVWEESSLAAGLETALSVLVSVTIWALPLVPRI